MRRAFSLLEVMVVLGVVALLAGSVFAFMLDLLRGREALSHATRDAIASAAIVERLEGDLLVAVADGAGEEPNGDRPGGRAAGGCASSPGVSPPSWAWRGLWPSRAGPASSP